MSDSYAGELTNRQLDHASELFLREKAIAGRQALDRALLTLSTGALALSLVFIDHFNGSPKWTELLYASWLAFVVAILSVIFSSGMTVTVLGQLSAMWGASDRNDSNTIIRTAKHADRVIRVALTAFTVAVVSFMIFVVVNRLLLWQTSHR